MAALNHFLKLYRYHIIIFLPVLLLASSFYVYYHPPFDLFPEKIDAGKSKVSQFVFNDNIQGGNSSALKYKTTSTTGLKYILRQGAKYPFAGITFNGNNGYINLSYYDEITIKIKALKGKRLPFVLYTFLDNYTVPENYETRLTNQFILDVNKEFQEITFPVSALSTPDWWFSQNKEIKNRLVAPDYSRIMAITVSNCIVLPKGEEDIIEIEKIHVRQNLFPFFTWSGAALAVYLIIVSVLIGFDKKKSINFQYQKLDTINRKDIEEESIFKYITANYSNSDLTVLEVQNGTGVSEYKIAGIIRKKTDLTFKQFLNKLRITEAKRLLLETDLQVSEIAFKSGYGSVSHFNRVFKEHEDCSPNEFRKQTNQV